MKNVLRQFALVFFILACTAGIAAAQPFPPIDVADDLGAVGKLASQRGAPIMLVFTQPDCPFCTRAKRDHLEAMRISANYGAKVIMREIVAADDRAALRDFAGIVTTHGDFARKYGIRTVPTVIVVDALGRPLAEPIVGLTAPDFYNLYLEQAIDAGRIQMRQK
jgi:thioredoxin-related protein